jgi:crotonobetainyl-CoA:carnitine CoA-transferase CaiB-like acyl-CoA transferase
MTASLFADLKVIDCASWIARPAAATILADFGADVIKIEPPGAPGRARPQPPDAYGPEHRGRGGGQERR